MSECSQVGMVKWFALHPHRVAVPTDTQKGSSKVLSFLHSSRAQRWGSILQRLKFQPIMRLKFAKSIHVSMMGEYASTSVA
ncbi:hypothetical protein FRX31_020436 [Thalictrum thalictroides]|uniref:Uncharacterized protein n=1 Tax=Thalictrum thalictroides TaxID=46969 RepID=A0A7J6VZ57_THATH|nr:hypothetical protein FRX31_020436 [Thalictrum thalictroides]